MANENPGHGVMAHVFMFVKQFCERSMADTIAKNSRKEMDRKTADVSRIEKDWKTADVETLIQHYEKEPTRYGM